MPPRAESSRHMNNFDNHWALCDKSGAIFYDESDRAHIYGTRDAARNANEDNSEQNLHVEKVEIK